MSAEKEIVNFWLNKKGFFTINNIKTTNKDIGILALKFNNKDVEEVRHFEIFCSITSSIQNLDASVKKIIDEKFFDNNVNKTIKKYLEQFNVKDSNKSIVLSNISNKKDVVKKFREKDIEVLEFENILADVIRDLDTQYYRNDIIRSLQLIKYLLMSNTKNLADVLVNNVFSQSARKDFMRVLLDNDEIIKEFRKTNEERLAMILKHSTLKNPEKLAELLENNILNRKTRKPFMKSLLEQKRIKKIYNSQLKIKKETPLNKFF